MSRSPGSWTVWSSELTLIATLKPESVWTGCDQMLAVSVVASAHCKLWIEELKRCGPCSPCFCDHPPTRGQPREQTNRAQTSSLPVIRGFWLAGRSNRFCFTRGGEEVALA